ncbi:hypothetical protein PoB_002966100 [Plakobranchus ocellatus]|uniref:Uncharacterized protein n=1 Tax=Plakobranchus ocellatus TaxID=259542 RepID=A0AAV4A4K6_9GAST|nr:hypothetical protein PoB_002966100 [Plakobranchus ocellatus]
MGEKSTLDEVVAVSMESQIAVRSAGICRDPSVAGSSHATRALALRSVRKPGITFFWTDYNNTEKPNQSSVFYKAATADGVHPVTFACRLRLLQHKQEEQEINLPYLHAEPHHHRKQPQKLFVWTQVSFLVQLRDDL